MGALTLVCHDVIDVFALTASGSKLLTRSDRLVLPGAVMLEDHAVKFDVVEDEKTPVDWRKLGRPQNWVKLGFKVGGVRVVKTSRSVIIHPGKLRGFNVDELEVLAGQVIERTRLYLESRYGLILSEDGVPLHKPCWRVYNPAAETWAKAGSVSVPGVGRLDRSPPERVAHVEYDQKQLAVDAVMAPVVLARIDQKLDRLIESQIKLVEQIGAFVASLQETGVGAPQKPNPFSV